MGNILNALGYGGIVAVIGMMTVFVGLILLILCISIMASFFKKADKKEKPVEAAPVAPAPVAAPVEQVVEETEVVDDAELIAVIAAAIAAFDNSGKPLVVRKVRRVAGWNKSSREEQVCRF